jgi:hypothetical protein
MERIPQVVFSFLRISREAAQRMGMIGCGIQLTEDGEYDWSQTTITLSLSNEAARCFITIEGIPYSNLPDASGRARIGILQFEEYMRYHSSILSFLGNYYSRKTIRLGPRARVPPWELNSHDSFILNMSEDDFRSKFFADPRGRLSTSEVIRGLTLHAPCMIEGIPELSGVPRQGGWIRTNSAAMN